MVDLRQRAKRVDLLNAITNGTANAHQPKTPRPRLQSGPYKAHHPHPLNPHLHLTIGPHVLALNFWPTPAPTAPIATLNSPPLHPA
jgi:hypothetical protein